MIDVRRILILATLLLSSCAGGPDAGSADSADPLKVVPRVDLDRYTGRWYEIARLPNRFQDDCLANVSAEYSLRDDGRIAVVNRCSDKNGKLNSAEGVARIVDPESNSKLKVRFAPAFLSFLSAVWGDYWIIDLAPDYSHAVIGEPRRRYLWILARSPVIEEATFNEILQRAEAQGYATDELIRTLHDE